MQTPLPSSGYAQLISGFAADAGLAIAHNPVGDELRIRVKSDDQTSYDPLSLGLFSFNEDHEELTYVGAHWAFSGVFPATEAMVKRVHEGAGFREKALHAQHDGAPDMSREQLTTILESIPY